MENEPTTVTLDGAGSVDESLSSMLGGATGAPPPEEQPAVAGDVQPSADADSTAGSDGGQESAAASIETLDQLAEELGVPLDQLLTVKTKLKVDGEEKDATLADLIKINQLEGHVNRKSIELSEKQKAWESEQGQMRQAWQQRIGFAGQVLDSQEAELGKQYQSVNWPALLQQDPAQYSALQLQFQQAAQQIGAQKQQLAQHWQQTNAQMREQLRPKALEAIRSQNPDLADPVSYGNALGEIKSYLKGIGANEANFEAVEMDPVVFRVARDAARYQAIAAKRDEVGKKVAAAPKFEKSSPRDGGNSRAKATYDRAMKGDEDALASILSS